MYLTNDEAKEKLCVRSMHLEEPLKCEGCECMAWLWTESKMDQQVGGVVDVKGRCGLVNISIDHSGRVR